MPTHEEQARLARNVSNPFADKVPHINEYTAKEIATLQSRLDKQLGPEYISSRPGAGGQRLHYVTSEKLINLANEVFGFNGWSSSIQNIQVDFVDQLKEGRINIGLSAVVRVILRDGTFHEDIGYGQCENAKTKAQAFEKAKKEAVTDAMKRSFRSFGNLLGNCIYDKDYLTRVTKIKVQPTKWSEDRLYRHQDYVPKPQPKPVPVENPVQNAAASGSASKSASTNASEFDSFGIAFDDFDESNFVPLDAVALDTPAKVEPESKNQPQPQQQQQQPQSVQTPAQPPQHRPQPVQQQRNVQANQPAQKTHTEVQGGQRAFPAQSKPSPPPGTNGSTTAAPQQTPPGQSTAPGQQPQHSIMHNGQRVMLPPPPAQKPLPQAQPPASNRQLGNNSLAQPNPSRPAQPGAVGAGLAEALELIRMPQQGQGSRPQSVGFVTGRSAEVVQQAGGPGAPLPADVPAFNPNAESPSLRRTSGVNHGSSRPILRSQVGVPPNAPAAGESPGPSARPANANQNGRPFQSVTPQGQQSPKNFINPQADPNRRIGMPPNRNGPLANRGAYKPPSIQAGAKRPAEAMSGPPRPPLADVSNVKGEKTTEGPEQKKVNLDTPQAPEKIEV